MRKKIKTLIISVLLMFVLIIGLAFAPVKLNKSEKQQIPSKPEYVYINEYILSNIIENFTKEYSNNIEHIETKIKTLNENKGEVYIKLSLNKVPNKILIKTQISSSEEGLLVNIKSIRLGLLPIPKGIIFEAMNKYGIIASDKILIKKSNAFLLENNFIGYKFRRIYVIKTSDSELKEFANFMYNHQDELNKNANIYLSKEEDINKFNKFVYYLEEYHNNENYPTFQGEALFKAFSYVDDMSVEVLNLFNSIADENALKIISRVIVPKI